MENGKNIFFLHRVIPPDAPARSLSFYSTLVPILPVTTYFFFLLLLLYGCLNFYACGSAV